MLMRYVCGSLIAKSRLLALTGIATLALFSTSLESWAETPRGAGLRSPAAALAQAALNSGRSTGQAEQMLAAGRVPAGAEAKYARRASSPPFVRITGTCRDTLRSFDTCISGRTYRTSSQAGAALLLPLGR